MLIAALLYYLAGIFGFGGAKAPLVIDIKKPVKEHVADPERKTKILAINETMQSQAQIFSAEFAAARKELSALHTRRLSTEADFDAIMTAIDAKRAALHAQLVAERCELQALMTASEWNKVYAMELADTTVVPAAVPATPAAHSSESVNQTTHQNKAACCESSGGRAALLVRPVTSP